MDNSSKTKWLHSQVACHNNANLTLSLDLLKEIEPKEEHFSEAQLMIEQIESLMSLKEKGNALFAAKNYQAAHDVYSEALEYKISNAFRSLCYSNRASCHKQLKQVDKAIQDYTESLACDANYANAYLRRGNLYFEIEMWEEALHDFVNAESKDPFGLSLTEKIILLKQKVEEDNKLTYYQILGVEKSATDAEIKKSYRKLIMMWHPDKMHSSGGSVCKAAKIFHKINEANDVLSDPARRQQYDAHLKPLPTPFAKSQ